MPRDHEGSIRYRTPEVPELQTGAEGPVEAEVSTESADAVPEPPAREPVREVGQVPPGAHPVEPAAQPPSEEAEKVPNPAETVLNRPPLAEVGVQAAEKVAAENVRMYPDPDDPEAAASEGPELETGAEPHNQSEEG